MLSLLIFFMSFAASQEFSIDISGLSNEEYNPGTELTFKIILLEDGIQAKKQVNYKINGLNKKEIAGTTNSDEETTIKIENDFQGGIWEIEANYLDTQVKRTFLVGENSEIEFLIKNDELIIKNIGNTHYSKTIQVKIGNEVNTYKQNIKVGGQKILKLISINGKYDIKVTDGKTTIEKKDVQLFGTGNIVGAVDKNLIGYTGFAGVNEPEKLGERKISLDKLPLSLIFITAVIILAVMTFIERKLSKKNTK